MDLTEEYMKGLLDKVILKARTRMQEAQPIQLRQSKIGEPLLLRTTQYVADKKKHFQIKDGPELTLMSISN